MSAYIIFNVTITDAGRYGEYVKHTPRIIAAHGGRMLVRGGDPAVIEGQAQGTRVVVIEFPDRAAALTFYTSPAYQAVAKIRDGAGVAHAVVVDGYPEATWTAAVTESQKHG